MGITSDVTIVTHSHTRVHEQVTRSLQGANMTPKIVGLKPVKARHYHLNCYECALYNTINCMYVSVLVTSIAHCVTLL